MIQLDRKAGDYSCGYGVPFLTGGLGGGAGHGGCGGYGGRTSRAIDDRYVSARRDSDCGRDGFGDAFFVPNTRLRLLGVIGFAEYHIWLDPQFGCARIGCQTRTINEWREQWAEIAIRNDCRVTRVKVKELLCKAEQMIKEATCSS